MCTPPPHRKLSKRREHTCESDHVSFRASIQGYSTDSSNWLHPLSPLFQEGAAASPSFRATRTPLKVSDFSNCDCSLPDFCMSGDHVTEEKFLWFTCWENRARFSCLCWRRHVASCARANRLSFKQRDCESLLYKEIQASNQGPFETSN